MQTQQSHRNIFGGPAKSGAHTVRARQAGRTKGEYLVSLSGHGGALPEFDVVTTVPANGSLLPSATGQIVVDFSGALMPSSLDASTEAFP